MLHVYKMVFAICPHERIREATLKPAENLKRLLLYCGVYSVFHNGSNTAVIKAMPLVDKIVLFFIELFAKRSDLLLGSTYSRDVINTLLRYFIP